MKRVVNATHTHTHTDTACVCVGEYRAAGHDELNANLVAGSIRRASIWLR